MTANSVDSKEDRNQAANPVPLQRTVMPLTERTLCCERPWDRWDRILAALSPGAWDGCQPRAGTGGHGVAVFPACPAQSSGGSGQFGAVTVG